MTQRYWDIHKFHTINIIETKEEMINKQKKQIEWQIIIFFHDRIVC